MHTPNTTGEIHEAINTLAEDTCALCRLCVSDVVHVMPGRLFDHFWRHELNRSTCFNESATMLPGGHGKRKGMGHHCFQQVERWLHRTGEPPPSLLTDFVPKHNTRIDGSPLHHMAGCSSGVVCLDKDGHVVN